MRQASLLAMFPALFSYLPGCPPPPPPPPLYLVLGSLGSAGEIPRVYIRLKGIWCPQK